MFHLATDLHRPMPEATLSGLMSAITNKLKFVVCPRYLFSSPYDVPSGPETLLVAYSDTRTLTYVNILPEILNKRWQTLDLKSMMSELQRSTRKTEIAKDTLSSVHRFKRKEGASLS